MAAKALLYNKNGGDIARTEDYFSNGAFLIFKWHGSVGDDPIVHCVIIHIAKRPSPPFIFLSDLVHKSYHRYEFSGSPLFLFTKSGIFERIQEWENHGGHCEIKFRVFIYFQHTVINRNSFIALYTREMDMPSRPRGENRICLEDF